MDWEDAYLLTKWYLDPSSCLATIGMGRKVGAMPIFRGQLVPILHSVAWAEAYLHTKWHLDPSSQLARIDMGQKMGGGLLCPFWEEARSPSNTMWSGPRPTSVANGIFATTDMGRSGELLCPLFGEESWVP